jgi:cytochrome c553
VLADNTCTRCHANRDAAMALQVPAGQLELTDGASNEVATQFQAYRELLATDNEQELVAGVLQDRQIQVGVDP